MGTTGNGWDDIEEHYFGQRDRLYMEARQAEMDRWHKIHKWKVVAYVAAIVAIPVGLAAWMIWVAW